MNIVEVQMAIEDDGLAYAIDNSTLNPDDIEDPVLADKILEIKELLKEINTYISEKVDELLDRNSDNCDYCFG